MCVGKCSECGRQCTRKGAHSLRNCKCDFHKGVGREPASNFLPWIIVAITILVSFFLILPDSTAKAWCDRCQIWSPDNSQCVECGKGLG